MNLMGKKIPKYVLLDFCTSYQYSNNLEFRSKNAIKSGKPLDI